jgi:hypothetical protein
LGVAVKLGEDFRKQGSLLQNSQAIGIPYSGTPSGLWFVPTAKLVLERPTPTRTLDASALFS